MLKITLSTILLVVLLAAPAAFAEGEYVPQQTHMISFDSGKLGNAEPVEKIVYSETVDILNAPWIRVFFHSVELQGDSYLRITSFQDGETQVMNKAQLDMWQNTTAYFNGPAVQVELIAGPGTVRNSVSIRKVLAGTRDLSEAEPPVDLKFIPSKVCNPVDERVLSNDPRVARLLVNNSPAFGSACTGWITNWCSETPTHANRCMLTAGHCMDAPAMTVAQFNVPLSNTDCTINMPPVSDQFPILPGFQFQNGGVGNDWAVFLCGTNDVGQTVKQRQGEGFALVGAAVGYAEKYGNGADGPATGDPDNTHCVCQSGGEDADRYLVQQYDDGAITAVVVGGRVDHSVMTCGGDSGCPILNADGQGVTIHTHGGCVGTPATTPANMGTDITHPGLQAALNDLCQPKKIPTLSEWGLLTVVLLLILAGATVIMRRRKELKNTA